MATPSAPGDKYLDVRSVLDYLDQRLVATARFAVEEHLGRPCASCREHVRRRCELLDLMLLDRPRGIPRWRHGLAFAAFTPRAPRSAVRRHLESLAERVLDSASTPFMAPARRKWPSPGGALPAILWLSRAAASR